MKNKKLNNHEFKELMRDLEDLNRDIAEYKCIFSSTIKTREMLLDNMKFFCTEEWANFIEEQKKEFGENVWEK